MMVESRHVLTADVVGKNNDRGKRAGSSEGADLLDIAHEITAAVFELHAPHAQILELCEALDDGKGQKQEDSEAREPVRDGRIGGGAAGEQAQGVEAGKNDHIY